ncbi:hypothetical protein [Scytonema millei]|nr:hypothetical protein [Scytonema millei]
MADSREQGVESREQGAGSREQGAEGAKNNRLHVACFPEGVV